MPVASYLSAINWGVQASAGAALSVESDSTLYTARTDTRIPPTTNHISGQQISALRDFANALSQHFKSGSRLRNIPVSASPFSAGEHGHWTLYAASGRQEPKYQTDSTAFQLLYQYWPRRLVTAATDTPTSVDQIVEVNRAGAVTITLPTISTTNGGRNIFITDISGAASSNNITINRGGSDTINGATSFTISTDYGGVWLHAGASSNWIILARSGAGTVTSITAGTGLTGGTITTSGTIALSTTVTVDTINATAATGKTITSAVADSGTNVGVIFNNSTALSGTTLLASFRNNGTQKVGIEDDGVVRMLTAVSTGTAAAFAAGAMLGTCSSITVTGNHESGSVEFTTGTVSGTPNGVMFTMTFSGGYAFPSGCTPIFYPANDTTALLVNNFVNSNRVWATGTTTTAVLNFNGGGGTGGLANTTTYKWNWTTNGY